MARIDWQGILYGQVKLLRARKSANAEQHAHAFHTPRAGFESAIVGLFSSLGEYAAAYAREYDSPVADDGVIGPCWRDAAKAARHMLNGETGRLDCGAMDSALCELAEAAGFDPDVW